MQRSARPDAEEFAPDRLFGDCPAADGLAPCGTPWQRTPMQIGVRPARGDTTASNVVCATPAGVRSAWAPGDVAPAPGFVRGHEGPRVTTSTRTRCCHEVELSLAVVGMCGAG